LPGAHTGGDPSSGASDKNIRREHGRMAAKDKKIKDDRSKGKPSTGDTNRQPKGKQQNDHKGQDDSKNKSRADRTRDRKERGGQKNERNDRKNASSVSGDTDKKSDAKREEPKQTQPPAPPVPTGPPINMWNKGPPNLATKLDVVKISASQLAEDAQPADNAQDGPKKKPAEKKSPRKEKGSRKEKDGRGKRGGKQAKVGAPAAAVKANVVNDDKPAANTSAAPVDDAPATAAAGTTNPSVSTAEPGAAMPSAKVPAAVAPAANSSSDAVHASIPVASEPAVLTAPALDEASPLAAKNVEDNASSLGLKSDSIRSIWGASDGAGGANGEEAFAGGAPPLGDSGFASTGDAWKPSTGGVSGVVLGDPAAQRIVSNPDGSSMSRMGPQSTIGGPLPMQQHFVQGSAPVSRGLPYGGSVQPYPGMRDLPAPGAQVMAMRPGVSPAVGMGPMYPYPNQPARGPYAGMVPGSANAFMQPYAPQPAVVMSDKPSFVIHNTQNLIAQGQKGFPGPPHYTQMPGVNPGMMVGGQSLQDKELSADAPTFTMPSDMGEDGNLKMEGGASDGNQGDAFRGSDVSSEANRMLARQSAIGQPGNQNAPFQQVPMPAQLGQPQQFMGGRLFPQPGGPQYATSLQYMPQSPEQSGFPPQFAAQQLPPSQIIGHDQFGRNRVAPQSAAMLQSRAGPSAQTMADKVIGGTRNASADNLPHQPNVGDYTSMSGVGLVHDAMPAASAMLSNDAGMPGMPHVALSRAPDGTGAASSDGLQSGLGEAVADVGGERTTTGASHESNEGNATHDPAAQRPDGREVEGEWGPDAIAKETQKAVPPPPRGGNRRETSHSRGRGRGRGGRGRGRSNVGRGGKNKTNVSGVSTHSKGSNNGPKSGNDQASGGRGRGRGRGNNERGRGRGRGNNERGRGKRKGGSAPAKDNKSAKPAAS